MTFLEKPFRSQQEAQKDLNFKARQGALLLRVAGDIKRNPEFLAQETGLKIDTVKAILSGYVIAISLVMNIY